VDVAIGVAGGTVKGVVTEAADDERRAARLDGFGSYAIFLPIVAESDELVGEASAPRLIGNTRRVIVLFASTETNAEGEPPAGEYVYGGGFFGEEGIVAEGAAYDGCDEADAVGDGSRRREGGHRVEAVVDEAVEDGEAGKGAFVSAGRPGEDEVAVRALEGAGKADADMHSDGPFFLEPTTDDQRPLTTTDGRHNAPTVGALGEDARRFKR
jgi:hypothetical protein